MDKDSFVKRKKVINDLIHDKFYTPMKAKEIAILLNIPKPERAALQEVLDALVAEGKIGLSKKGKYQKAENTAIIGRFESHQKGFGFVVVEGEPDDIYVAEKDINGALHNDTVKVAVTVEKSESRRREGRILQVIKRGTEDIVGYYKNSGGYGFVIPDNQRFSKDIFVPGNKSKGAVEGHKVIVHITDYGDEKHKPEGEVVRIIGHVNDPGTDILSIVAGYDIPMEYSEETMKQTACVPDRIYEEDMAGRKDCRDWQTVTIDGEDAKDLDDAITLTKENDLYRLGVHIADVSQYVGENTPLDKEAWSRGTSVYLVDRVIPMLPHKLSNGICSLNQGVDRLALSCIMDIDSKGNVVNHEICETVVNVDRRMSYTAVKKILEDNDEDTIKEYKELVPMFRLMDELAHILRNKRHGRGSVDFDFPESKITLDSRGMPVSVKAYERNSATKIIEDFMLIANETVAEDCFWQELPFIYRTHDNPDPEKIQALGAFINNFGYSIHISNEDIHPKEIQKLLEKIEGTDEEAMLSRLTLRSMKRAQYTTECTGHFGLAAKYYTHFTSPIRRYPDLQIHRIIKENLHGGLTDKRISHYEKILPETARQCSTTERRADDAERDVEKLKKTQYMSRHIGEKFEGVISGLTQWGIYVELPNTIEGMVHVSSLDGDYYIYDESHYEMVGEVTKKTYKLGQRLKVKCTGADIFARTIDFHIVEISDEDEQEVI
ncbi:MAG: ribonuclease R [Butyrivibrio sp.]